MTFAVTEYYNQKAKIPFLTILNHMKLMLSSFLV